MAEVCVCQAGVRTQSGQVQGPSAGPQLMLPVLINFRGFVRPCLVTLAGCEVSMCRDLPNRRNEHGLTSSNHMSFVHSHGKGSSSRSP